MLSNSHQSMRVAAAPLKPPAHAMDTYLIAATSDTRRSDSLIQGGIARFLIRNRGTRLLGLEVVFTMVGVTIIRTRGKAPNANAFAERWTDQCGRRAWTSA